jgi:DNA-binding NarL/FixJ family response regulator
VKPESSWEPGPEDDRVADEGPDAGSESIRLVLVEPRALHGAMVRELLEREVDFDVVASVRTPDEAVGRIVEQSADVLVVDVDTPDPDDTLEGARRLKRRAPDAAMVILGREANDDAVFRAVQAGATAHVTDNQGPAELVDAIRRVADGQDPLGATVAERPAVVQRVADAYRELAVKGARGDPAAGGVSPRQLEVLRLVARGMSNDEIAERMSISRQTVKNHLSAAMRTLGVRRRGEAVAMALRAGWLSLR